MTGFELRTSGAGSDRPPALSATTTFFFCLDLSLYVSFILTYFVLGVTRCCNKK